MFKEGGCRSIYAMHINHPRQCDLLVFGVNEADAFGGAAPRLVVLPFEGKALMRLAGWGSSVRVIDESARICDLLG